LVTHANSQLLIFTGSPWDSLKAGEVPIPDLEDNEVLVEVHAASINPIDTWMRGGYGRRLFDNFRPLPFIPGRDFSGKIVQLGPSAFHYRVGDLVYGATAPTQALGSYAQYVKVNEHYIAPKPHNLSHREAASIPYAGLTGWEAVVNVASVKPGQSVLVLGASGGIGIYNHNTNLFLGLFLVQLLKNHYGCTVVGTSGEKQLKLLDSLGINRAINYKENDYCLDKFDIVVDLVGAESRQQALQYLKPGGHLVSTAGELIRRTDERGILSGLLSAATELVGEKMVLGGAQQIQYNWVYYKSDGKALSKIARMIEEKKIKPIVDEKQFSLLEIPLAHEYFEGGNSVGKVVININQKV
jgi:alcohol dehydrogenase